MVGIKSEWTVSGGNRWSVTYGDGNDLVCPSRMMRTGSEMNLSLREWYDMHNESVVEYICIYNCICCWLFMILTIGSDYVIIFMDWVWEYVVDGCVMNVYLMCTIYLSISYTIYIGLLFLTPFAFKLSTMDIFQILRSRVCYCKWKLAPKVTSFSFIFVL